MRNRTKRIIVLFLFFCCVNIWVFGGFIDVFAGGGQGTGGGAGNGGNVSDPSALCLDNNYTSPAVCTGNGMRSLPSGSTLKKSGGASWHIFKTGSKTNKTTNLYIEPAGGPTLGTFGEMSNGYDNKLATKCPHADYTHYFAFVYDGWNRPGSKDENAPKLVLWGPLRWDEIGEGKSLQYNDLKGSYSYGSINDKIKNGENVHKAQITAAAARQFYKNYYLETHSDGNAPNDIPGEIGYFCYNSGEATLRLIAVDESGNEIPGHEKTHTVKIGDKATVKADTTIGAMYVYQGIFDKKVGGTRLVDNNNYTYSAKIKKDKTVYARYRKMVLGECGEWTPASYINSNSSHGETSTVSKVRKGDGDWADSVYVKPDQKVSWIHCYYPGVQTVAYTKVDGRMMKDLVAGWENRYSVKSFLDKYNKNGTLGIGDYKAPSAQKNNDYSVSINNVGSSLTESMVTGVPRSAVANGGTWSANLIPYSSSAVAYVPYNYINTASVTAEGEYYAGEGAKVTGHIITWTKKNDYTSPDEEYATIVKKARREIRMRYNNDSGGVKDIIKDGDFQVDGSAEKNVLNPSGYSEKEQTFNEEVSFTVPDLPAGTQICFDERVYPSDSGPDDNIKEEGSGRWTDWVAGPCVYVAKRPSIQAWGGNVYSTGAIKTSRSVKQDLYGSNNSKKPYVFGSWGELGVISAGGVSGFASGASLGYKNNDGKAWPSYVGNTDGYALDSDYPGGGFGSSDFCNYSVLTFPNSGCSGALTSGISYSGTNTTKGLKDNKNALENLIDIGGTINKKKSIGDNKLYIDGANDDGYNWISKEDNNDLEITGGVLMKDTFKIVAVSSNIIISGDIKVGDDVVLENFDQAPKVVLYSKKDIKIGCDVVRLDAILVAEGSVITCASDEDIDSEVYSKQLIVNGAIITSKLKANRTYGAGRGINSIVPAEIVNFDPTLYLWGGAAGNKTENNEKNIVEGNLNVTYINELGPRY